MLISGASAGAEVAGVVEIAAVEDRCESSLAGDLCQSSVQLVFAVEAAVRVVLHIIGVVHLARVDELVRDPDLSRERLRLFYLRRRHRGRDARDCERLFAEDVMRDGGDERGVHAAGIGDDRRTGFADDGLKAGQLRLESGLDCHGGNDSTVSGSQRAG